MSVGVGDDGEARAVGAASGVTSGAAGAGAVVVVVLGRLGSGISVGRSS